MKEKAFYKQVFILLAILCFTFSIHSQTTIADWRAELDKATSAKAKAYICFEIAERYSTSLKIDSALYFASAIGEYSQQSNYVTGTGMYHLAYAPAIYYRSRNDKTEESAMKAIGIFTVKSKI